MALYSTDIENHLLIPAVYAALPCAFASELMSDRIRVVSLQAPERHTLMI